ncbi:MAG TPA: hypothetical protein VFE60_25710 [Roseiarcus sp.]|jgi:hypothetical protein|nr:hypothetical protein [Roseiarcus sp.]
MQANFKRGKATPGVRSVGRSVGILAGVPVIATLALCTPNAALAACGASHPAGVHAAGGGGGVHVATSMPATSGGGGGGGVGTLGCANGASAAALRGLPTASSGRVVEPNVHAVAHMTAGTRTATARTATTRTANASARFAAVRPPQRAFVRR